jgi:hypothetical protein
LEDGEPIIMEEEVKMDFSDMERRDTPMKKGK